MICSVRRKNQRTSQNIGDVAKKLSEISGIGQSSISRYETGDGGITLDYILKLAETLECSPLYLVAEEFGFTSGKDEKAGAISPKEIEVLRKHLKDYLDIIGE
ncbi:MAG: helix-turn-helix transcriptional regulator [Synergistes jonesii]|uniref:helix-turn-helix domain-containing protein n=1 Tax=Synergistes jonesii TaxID=2754 RepID=UPI002A751F5A|nr:helix-turn-helix transcriptional regulator [Synergistes jonesii]MDY2983834.1 helix-turn-helix transcriptional regulator [Synergistes jonesii]